MANLSQIKCDGTYRLKIAKLKKHVWNVERISL